MEDVLLDLENTPDMGFEVIRAVVGEFRVVQDDKPEKKDALTERELGGGGVAD